MSTRIRISLATLCLIVLFLVACNSNPQPPGLTPIPTLAPAAVLTPIDSVSGAATTEEATSAPTSASPGTPEATEAPAEFAPPNCGPTDCTKNGPAITQNLKGDSVTGQKIFAANCAVCHGPQGAGGIPNPGAEDQTVPSLNPIDPMFNTKDSAQFAKQLDLYVEHGSHTDGLEQMPNWGDTGSLTAQQIADVIAYLMSLNQQ